MRVLDEEGGHVEGAGQGVGEALVLCNRRPVHVSTDKTILSTLIDQLVRFPVVFSEICVTVKISGVFRVRK